ncbi:MAG: hypothetical protein ACJ8AT_11480 [Hyalangium sp.]|uniref:hypothetical protein n=1 Tax=Hyalangium sp. TaxID=2028555 RepID=UPI00389A350C
MATPPRDSNTGTPAPDAATVTRYWTDMLQGSSTFLLGQVGRWSRALDQMRTGTYAPSSWMQDMTGTLDELTLLIALPFQWMPQSAERQLPTFLFVVDGDTEFVGPMDASTAVFLPPGVTITVTDLYLIGGDGTGGGQAVGKRSINANDHVQAQLSPQSDRVEVTLVDLGRGQSRRTVQGINPGLYVGAVYATEVATRRPLAVIYALVEASEVP